MGDLIVNALKIAFWVSIGLVFMTAISALLNLISSIMFNNVFGEVLSIISMCLPFDAVVVFDGLSTACSAILAFLVAQKLYDYSLSFGSST